jgi:hypothetical protein
LPNAFEFIDAIAALLAMAPARATLLELVLESIGPVTGAIAARSPQLPRGKNARKYNENKPRERECGIECSKKWS